MREERKIDTRFVPPDRDEDNLVIPVGVPLFPSSGQENLSKDEHTGGPCVEG